MDIYYNFVLNNPVLFSLFIVLTFLILYFEIKKFTQKFKEISPQDAVFLYNDNAVFLDVRESNEIKNGKIKDSKHLSLSALSNSIDNIKQYQDKSVVVYCKAGVRASTAANILIKNNFDNVYSLRGGFEAWLQENLPVERK